MPRARFLKEFGTRLRSGAQVLDLGCGAGLPSTAWLAERYRVTGVDLSAGQLEAARRNVPEATFLNADMATHELPDRSFDASLRSTRSRTFRATCTPPCSTG